MFLILFGCQCPRENVTKIRKILKHPQIIHLHMKQEKVDFPKPSSGLQYSEGCSFQRTGLLSHACTESVSIRVDLFFFLFEQHCLESVLA